MRRDTKRLLHPLPRCLVLTRIQGDEPQAPQVVAFDVSAARSSSRGESRVKPAPGALAIPSPPIQQSERVVRKGEPQVVAKLAPQPECLFERRFRRCLIALMQRDQPGAKE